MHKNPLRALENLLKTPKDPQSNSSKKSLRIPNKSSKTTLYFKTKQLQNPHRIHLWGFQKNYWKSQENLREFLKSA